MSFGKTLFRRLNMGKVVEGVFAINKPAGITSAQVLRDLQKHFNPSELFAPWIAATKAQVARDSHNQRKRRKQKETQVKIGHGGTLDPLATGVLIAGVGKGTKGLQDFLLCTKTYETIVLFGASTDTYDRTGKILKRAPYQHLTKELVEDALGHFRGKIMQLPPLYSALKMNGKPLYEYAREGKEIPREIERRAVEVVELDLLEWYEGGSHEHRLPTEEAGTAEKSIAEALWKQEKAQDTTQNPDDTENLALKKRKWESEQDALVTDQPASKRTASSPQDASMSGGLNAAIVDGNVSKAPVDLGPPAAKIRMTVTSGFYVRSLCQDLGEALGSAANMAELIRSRQGQFELGKNVLEYSDLEKGEKVWGPQIERMLDEWANDYKPLTGSSAEKIPVKSVEPADVDAKKEAQEEAAEIPAAAILAETGEEAKGDKVKKEAAEH